MEISKSNEITSIVLKYENSTGSHIDVYTAYELLHGKAGGQPIYDVTTALYTFRNIEAAKIEYSVRAKERTGEQENESYMPVNLTTTFTSLNGNSIPLKKKKVAANLGKMNIYCNWTPVEDNIFDLYTLVYEGEAPLPTDEKSSENKLLELSFNQSSRGAFINKFHIPQNETTNGINLIYNTDLDQKNADWCPGETTSIQFDDGVSFEDIFRKYSFVFILNDYGSNSPGSSNNHSKFKSLCGDVRFNIEVLGDINYVKTIKINLPDNLPVIGDFTENGEYSSNWIGFKTRILGENETIAEDLSNLIVEFTDNNQYKGYSCMDSSNSAKTSAYEIENGGHGYGPFE